MSTTFGAGFYNYLAGCLVTAFAGCLLITFTGYLVTAFAGCLAADALAGDFAAALCGDFDFGTGLNFCPTIAYIFIFYCITSTYIIKL